ncbi:MAG: stage sporulation protein [Paenibacillus sp.]|jgi:stage II sporulation protein D|nr:stage sporulation protein [Paenibacillus sp.]
MRKTVAAQLWMPIAAMFATVLFVILIVPGVLVETIPEQGSFSDDVQAVTPVFEQSQQVIIPIYLTRQQKIDQVPLETYVRNVLAAEMPASFELEALKAQAIASRTYIVKRWLDGDSSQVPVQGAIVTDTVAHQAYMTEDQMKQSWSGKQYESNVEKLNRAVSETAGIIATYQHKPIQASFFSTSNGYTENSEEYWRDAVPYLRSVPSPWDASLSPKYEANVTYSLQEFAKRLNFSSVPANLAASMKVLSTTSGHRIKTMAIGGKTFTGREIREKLELNSSQFTWKVKGASIELQTLGYGHGVGMSQWGANGMAKEGKTAEAILKYYYQGIELENDAKLLAAR